MARSSSRSHGARPPVVLVVLIVVVTGLFSLSLLFTLLSRTSLFDPEVVRHKLGESFTAAGRTYTLSDPQPLTPTEDMLAYYDPLSDTHDDPPPMFTLHLSVTVQEEDPEYFAPTAAMLTAPAAEGDYTYLVFEESDQALLELWSRQTGLSLVTLVGGVREEGLEGRLLFVLSPDCDRDGEVTLTLEEYGDTVLESYTCVAEHVLSFPLPKQ